jgi:hypothetical protein
VFSRHLLTVLFLFASLAAGAQDEPAASRVGSSIIDDSTKNVYGPTTSRYFYESDFFRNNFQLHALDTVAWDFHRFNYVQRYNNFYQDLGNIGTAIRPIFTEVPENIGATSGFTAYDLYWNAEAVKYYNTKSPFANVKWVLGGKGRSYARITFTRNINPRWNAGFNYRILQIDKITARSAKGDRTTKSNYFDFFTSYQSKDSTYSLFFNARRDFMQLDENGGVQTDENFTFSDLFQKQDISTWLTLAESNDKRGALHLFHQLDLASGLQLYHISDLYRQINRFNDTDHDNAYYDFILIDSAKTRDRTAFKSFRNEVGVKGSLFKAFYNGYAAFRKYSIDYKYIYEDNFYLDTEKTEVYVGGRVGLQLDSLVEVKGWAEWMLDDRYVIHGSIKTKWFEASAKRSVSTPAFVPQAYRGSHDLWINNFGNVEGTELRGNLIYTSNVVSIYPGVRFSTFKNYIFFKEDTVATGQDVLPYQTSGYQTWVSPELNVSVKLFDHLTLKGQGIYTRILENSDDAMQFPELFVNAQLAYADIWFKGNFDFQVGIDTHWKSSYYAPGYDITSQQFYTQQRYLSPAFPVMDLFLNVRIKRARIFVKYNNALKTFTSYANVPTPFYPGIGNLIDFGFDWSFFD